MPEVNNNNNERISINGVDFEVQNFIPFPTKGDIDITTSSQLGIEISTYFKEIFSDYKGVSFTMENGVLKPILWFSKSVKNNGAIEAMVSNKESENGSSAERWNNTFLKMNSMIQGKNKPFTLSEKGKHILKAFAPTKSNGKVNWDQLIKFREQNSEQNTRYAMMKTETVMKIVGLDLIPMLIVMHGNKKEVQNDERKPKHNVSYEVSFIQFLHPEKMMPQQTQFGILTPNYDDGIQEEMLIRITRLDLDELDKVAAKLGVYPSVNTIPMY